MNRSLSKRALQTLELLAGKPTGLSLTELCEALSVPKSIAHRLLSLLVESGFAHQEGLSARYVLTLKLTMLGLRHYVGLGLDDLAQPILDRLALETGELARLAVVEGNRLCWVAKAQGARTGLRYDPTGDQDSGQTAVLHVTATGKAWLATLPESEALAIVEATGRVGRHDAGPKAARTLEDFRTLLDQTRRDGYGEAVEEGEPGTGAVAVAVLDPSRASAEAVATISLAGPLLRFGPDRRPLLARRLAAAALELGAIWPVRVHGAALRNSLRGRLTRSELDESDHELKNATTL